MSSWIEGVKNNIKTVSDGLDKQYRGCDLRFAFVRYTDYDQPVQTKTTWIDFTKLLENIVFIYKYFVGQFLNFMLLLALLKQLEGEMDQRTSWEV